MIVGAMKDEAIISWMCVYFQDSKKGKAGRRAIIFFPPPLFFFEDFFLGTRARECRCAA